MNVMGRRGFMGSLAGVGTAAATPARNLRDQGGKEFADSLLGVSPPARAGGDPSGESIFNVKDFGATGKKSDDALPAIQKAVDACAAAGGGTIYVPPGEYTSGTIHLRSHVRFYVEGGATLFASTDSQAYDVKESNDSAALFYGIDLENISIEGRGTIDGQHEFMWMPQPENFERAYGHLLMMKKLGKSLMRSFPVGFPQRQVYPHLVWIYHCKDVQISGLSFVRSPSWTYYLKECERVLVDGVYMYTSLKDAVWCDGIDIDGCKDVHIANSTIETGDDCIAIFAAKRAAENITIVNCRFSSASAAIKFTEGVAVAARNVVIDNCVITNTNRGITLQIESGGTIEDVIISNITMYLHRYDWFWAGDANPFNFEIKTPSEWNLEPPKTTDPGPGLIRNVMIRNIIAHVQGSSLIEGHPTRPLEGVTFEGIRLFISTDPASPYDTSVHALQFHWARNLKLKDVEVIWEKPSLEQWQSALRFENIDGLEVDDFTGRQAWPDREAPAMVLDKVIDARITNCKAPEGTTVFLEVSDKESRSIALMGNDLHKARVPYHFANGASSKELRTLGNLLPTD
jgi:hypothetical protein